MMSPAPAIKPRPPLPRSLSSAAANHAPVIRETILLSSGPIAGAFLGFVFWWIAARNFDPHETGLATAALSAINFIVLISTLALPTSMMGLPLARAAGSPALVAACSVVISAIALVVFSSAFALLHVLNFDVAAGIGGVQGALLVATGALVMINSELMSGALTGFERNKERMLRELISAVSRVVLLIGVAGSALFGNGFAVLVMIGIAAEMLAGLAVCALLFLTGRWQLQRPDFRGVLKLLPLSLSHHGLNLTCLSSAALMPLLVAEVVSPAVAGAFYPAWMLMQTMLLIPGGASTALFALGVHEPDQMSARMRFSLLASLAIGAAAALAMMLFLVPFLAYLNPAYPHLTGEDVRFLGFGGLGLILKHHYLAAARHQSSMGRATPVLALAAVAEIGGAGLGGYCAGATGLIYGWLAGTAVLSMLLLPGIRRVMAAPDAQAVLRSGS